MSARAPDVHVSFAFHPVPLPTLAGAQFGCLRSHATRHTMTQLLSRLLEICWIDECGRIKAATLKCASLVPTPFTCSLPRCSAAACLSCQDFPANFQSMPAACG